MIMKRKVNNVMRGCFSSNMFYVQGTPQAVGLEMMILHRL